MFCTPSISCRSFTRNEAIAPPQTVYHGFLYKILGTEGKTLGYLFGTLHSLKDARPTLSNKVFKSLSKCQTILPEIDLFDKNSAFEFLKTEYPTLNEGTLRFLARLASELKEAGGTITGGVEYLLLKKAHSLGLSISALETADSRALTERLGDLKLLEYLIHSPSKRSYNVSLQFSSACFATLASVNLLFIRKKIESGESADVHSLVLVGSMFLVLSLSAQTISREYRGMFPLFTRIIEGYRQLCNKYSLSTRLITLAEIIFNVKCEGKSAFFRYLEAAFKEGEEKQLKILFKINDEVRFGFIEDLRQIAAGREIYLRDRYMAEKIHRDLLNSASSERRRSFYAVGCKHLFGSYENLRKQIEKKGWKVVRVSTLSNEGEREA